MTDTVCLFLVLSLSTGSAGIIRPDPSTGHLYSKSKRGEGEREKEKIIKGTKEFLVQAWGKRL